MITVARQTTTRTAVDTLFQGHLLPVSALVAVLAGVRRVDLHELATGAFSLVRKEREELRPRRIHNAFRQTMIVNHSVRVNIFDIDHAEPIYDFTAFLMSKVTAPICNAPVHFRESLSSFLACMSRCSRNLTLNALQVLFITAIETRIGNWFAGRQIGEITQANINADRLTGHRKRLAFAFYREAGEPFICLTANATCFDYADDRPMDLRLNIADFRQGYRIGTGTKTRLREGKRIISVLFEAWKSGFLTTLDTSEESIECEINTNGNILQNLTVNITQFSMRWFPTCDHCLLFSFRRTLTCRFVQAPSIIKQRVINKATHFKRVSQFTLLLFRRIKPVFISQSHVYSIPYWCCKREKLGRLYPLDKSKGLYAGVLERKV